MAASETLASARAYLEQGRRPIPVPKGSKAPIIEGWQTLHLGLDDLPRYFSNGQNIGILNGQPSGDLIDVDLDCVEAVQIGGEILPQTGAVFGRDGKGRSHYLFISQLATKQYRDVDGAMLLELRSSGSQTIWPPSVADGKGRRWDREGVPAEVAPGDLAARAGRLAAACLLARHWPKQGGRHDASLALAGGLLRGGWAPDAITTFVQIVVQAAGDREVRDRVNSVTSTVQRVQHGGAATGWPRLAELIGEPVVSRVRDWLNIGPEASGAEPRSGVKGQVIDPDDGPTGKLIQVNGRFMRDITRESLATLAEANFPTPSVFRRGDVLVQVARRSKALEARPLRSATLKGLLDRAANFVKIHMTKAGPVFERLGHLMTSSMTSSRCRRPDSGCCRSWPGSPGRRWCSRAGACSLSPATTRRRATSSTWAGWKPSGTTSRWRKRRPSCRMSCCMISRSGIERAGLMQSPCWCSHSSARSSAERHRCT